MQEIHVLDVNQHTLDMFAAKDKKTLLARLPDVFRDDMRPHFREQLIDLWDGKLFQQREVLNYSLDGNELHVHLQFSVLPGHERDWDLVLVALTDITARKKAEAYLEFLGKHDVLTKLHNRSFYVDELNRLERKGPCPVTIIMADLNGLKRVNDQLGHAAGDALLRRAGEVLAKAMETAVSRGAHRRRRICDPDAGHRRARRRGDDRRDPATGGDEQPVLSGLAAELLDGRGDLPARRPARSGRAARRPADVRGEARALREPAGGGRGR